MLKYFKKVMLLQIHLISILHCIPTWNIQKGCLKIHEKETKKKKKRENLKEELPYQKD